MSGIFISHSSRDAAASASVNERLRAEGHRSVFLDFDPEQGIPPGRDWERELYLQLRSCRAVLVLCSEHSMASHWVFAEITHAKALGKPLFPIKVAACEIHHILTSAQVLDLTAGEEQAFSRLWRGFEAAGIQAASDHPRGRPPYPGLAAFEAEDAAVFFGRDDEIQRGLETLGRMRRLGGARALVILGASGSGKSSLLRAGLLPRLGQDRERWLVVGPMRPGDRPLGALASALEAAFEEAGAGSDDLEELLAGAAGLGRRGGAVLEKLASDLLTAAGRSQAAVLLVIDQAEELLHGEEQGLPSLLAGALGGSGGPLMAAFTLRSDFLGQFQQHPALRALGYEDLKVGPMPPESLAQIIERPAAEVALDLEPGLSQAMVADCETDDALPLLAFALRELYERHGRDGKLTVAEYRDDLGGLEGSVARAADTVYRARPLSEDEESALRKAFLSMVRYGGEGQFVRQPARWADMPAAAKEALERFEAARLLLFRGEGENRALEVAHEALFRSWDRFEEWLRQDKELKVWQARLRPALEQWQRTGDAGALLRGQGLREAETWYRERRADLEKEEQEFVAGSLEHESRRKRRSISFLTAFTVVALILATVALFGWQSASRQRQEAERQTSLATARQLAADSAEALGNSAEGLTLSALLAVESLQRRRTPQGFERWAEAMRLLPEKPVVLPVGERVEEIVFLDDGVLVRSAGAVSRWDAATGEERVRVGHSWPWQADFELPGWAFDGRRKLLVTADGETVRAWDPETLESRFSTILHAVIETVAVSPDGRWVAAATRQGSSHERTLVILDATDDRTEDADRVVQRVEGLDPIMVPLAFSSGGVFLGAGTSKGIRVWRLDPWAEEVLGSTQEWIDREWGPFAFSPNGRWLASWQGSVWKIGAWEDVRRIEGRGAYRHPVAFSPDSRWLILQDDSVQSFWDTGTWEKASELFTDRPVAFSPQTRTIAVATGPIVETGNPEDSAASWSTVEHPRPVTRFVFSPGGERLATADEGGTVRIRSEAFGEELRMAAGGPISTLAFSPDERLIAAGAGSAVRIWDVEPPTYEGRQLAEGRGELFGVANEWLVTRSRGTAAVRRLGEEAHRIEVSHAPDLEEGRLSLDGRWLAKPVSNRGSRSAETALWDLEKHEERTLRGSPVAFSPEGRWLILADKTDAGVRSVLWSLKAAAESAGQVEVGQSGWHRTTELRASFSADSALVAIGSGATELVQRQVRPVEGHLRVRATGSWEVVRGWDFEWPATAVAMAPDGALAACALGIRHTTGLRPSRVGLWDVDSGSQVADLEHGDVHEIRFAADGNTVVTVSLDAIEDPDRFRVWDVAAAVAGASWKSEFPRPGNLMGWSLAADGGLLAGGTADGRVLVWRTDTGDELARASPGGLVESLAFSDDGDRLKTVSRDGLVREWLLGGGPELEPASDSRPASDYPLDGRGRALERHGAQARIWDRVASRYEIKNAHVSPDGRWLATVGADHIVGVWDVATGERLVRLGFPDAPQWLRFSRDGLRLAAASGALVCLTELVAQPTPRCRTLARRAAGIALADDGRQIAIHTTARGAVDRVRLWRAGSSSADLILQHDREDSLSALAFGAGDRRLATGSVGGTLSVWDVETGDRLLRRGLGSRVENIVFDPEGRWLAIDAGSRLLVVDAGTGEEMADLGVVADRVRFSPDGRTLVAVRDKHEMTLPWSVDHLRDSACARLERNLSYRELEVHLPGLPYEKTCPELPAHPSVAEAAERLAADGDFEGAVAIYRQLLAAEAFEGDVAAEAERRASPALIADGRRLARAGRIREALAAFDRARKLDPEVEIDAVARNTLCWNGSVWGRAADVLGQCELALEQDPGNPRLLDSRGLARALSGDARGAIADFQAYAHSNRITDEEQKQLRRDWTRALRVGGEPFTPEVLEDLRADEPE